MAVDMKMSIPAMPQAAGTNVDGKTKAVFPGYPVNMLVGRELHGGSFEMKSETKEMEMVPSNVLVQ